MKRKVISIGMLAMLLYLAACGNESKVHTDENNAEKQSIQITDLQNNTVELDDVPERIVSLITGDLNTLYDLGAEAVGRPIIRGKMNEEIAALPEVGTSNDVNIEKVTGLQPDLVIAHPQLNSDAIPVLEDMGITVIQMGASSIEEVKQSIQILGDLVQKQEKAEQIISEIDTKKADGIDKDEDPLRTLIIFGSAGNWMVALPTSLSGNMLEVVGGYNIAQDYEKLERFPQYAQLDMEKIIEADPEAILFITAGPMEETAASFLDEMEQNPAWSEINAIKNDHFIRLPNELFGANPGSHIIESLDYLSEELAKIQK